MAPEKSIHSGEHVRPPKDSEELVADRLLTVQECAEFLHLSRSKVYELMDAGALCYVKLGRSRRIPRRAVIELVVAFYTELKNPSISKAVALQRAQQKLLEGRRYAHPFYWSPYLLISNWLW